MPGRATPAKMHGGMAMRGATGVCVCVDSLCVLPKYNWKL